MLALLLHIVLGIALSGVLWFACIFSGTALQNSFKPTFLPHTVCALVALVTASCFVVIFQLNRVNKGIDSIGQTMVSVATSNKSLLDKINALQEDSDAGSDIAQTISKEYPSISRYVNFNALFSSANYTNKINQILQNPTSNKAQEIAELSVRMVIEAAMDKVKSIRNKFWIVLVVVQSLAFGFVVWAASRRINTRNTRPSHQTSRVTNYRGRSRRR